MLPDLLHSNDSKQTFTDSSPRSFVIAVDCYNAVPTLQFFCGFEEVIVGMSKNPGMLIVLIDLKST